MFNIDRTDRKRYYVNYMKQLPLIIGIIIVLLVGVGGGYYYMTQQASTSSEKDQPETTMTEEKETNGMMSLKDIMALGRSMKCTFEYSSADTGMTSGTSYVSGKNVRTDYTITDTENKTTNGGMIMLDSTMYTWTNQEKKGVKMTITEEMQDSVQEEIQDTEWNNQYMSPDEELDYNCTAWNEDPSIFAPPADIEFMDLSEQMKVFEDLQKSMGSDGTTSPAASCAVCDSMPEEAAAACRSSLNCE